MAFPAPPDPAILDYGSPMSRQREKIQAWIDHGSARKAAEAVGCAMSGIVAARDAVQKRAEKAGWSPMMDGTKHVPSTEQVIGRSVLTKDSDGNTIWVKTKARKETEEALKEYVAGIVAGIKPAKPVAKPKKKMDENLMASIWIGDAHIGMYAWSKETNIPTSTRTLPQQGLREAVDDLIERAPPAKTCLIVDVGDFMHFNSSSYTTLKGTKLDVDTRYSRVLRVAGQVMNYIVARALQKFEKVVVCIAKGNHNEDPAVAVQEIVSAYYHKEPRVQVLDTDGYFHYIEYGKWLIGVNHGDKVKAKDLVSVMARDMAAAWGRTTFRMWGTGHFHHEQVLELEGCTVRKFGALPPPDSWHAGSGYGGDGHMQSIVFRKEGGIHSIMSYDLVRPEVQPDATIL